MAPDVAIGNECKSKESGKASFQRKLSSNANQLTPGGRRNTTEVFFSAGSYSQILNRAAQDSFLLPLALCQRALAHPTGRRLAHPCRFQPEPWPSESLGGCGAGRRLQCLNFLHKHSSLGEQASLRRQLGSAPTAPVS